MGGLLQKDKFPNLASIDVISTCLKAVPLSHFLAKHAGLRRAAGKPRHPLKRPQGPTEKHLVPVQFTHFLNLFKTSFTPRTKTELIILSVCI